MTAQQLTGEDEDYALVWAMDQRGRPYPAIVHKDFLLSTQRDHKVVRVIKLAKRYFALSLNELVKLYPPDTMAGVEKLVIPKAKADVGVG